MPRPAASRFLLFLLLACYLPPLLASGEQGGRPLVPFTAEYRLTYNGIPVGQTHVSLQLLPDGGYIHRARTEPNAMISLIREDLILEESRGRVVSGRPRPDRYLYQRESPSIQRSLHLDFDWLGKQVQIRDEHSNWRMGISTKTLDKLVQQLVFTRELRDGIRTVHYRVADGGRLKDYAYRVLGRELAITPLGRFETFKVERTKDDKASDYTLWLAPELDHRPVRILRRHEGSLYRMELVKFESDGKLTAQGKRLPPNISPPIYSIRHFPPWKREARGGHVPGRRRRGRMAGVAKGPQVP